MSSNSQSVVAGGRVDGTSDNGLVVKLNPRTKLEEARVELSEMVMQIGYHDDHVVAVGQTGTIWVLSADNLLLLRTITLNTGPYTVGSLLFHNDQLLLTSSTHRGEDGAILVLNDWRPL